MLKKATATVLAACLLTMGGCASRQLDRGAVRMVEASGGKPGWLERRSFEQDQQAFFVGSIREVQDLSLGEEQAEYQAKKVIASAIQEVFQREFSTATVGNNRSEGGRLGQAIESALTAVTDRVQVRGVLPVERYWERLEVGSDDGVRTAYNVSVLVRIPVADFERAKHQVYEDLQKQEQIKADAGAQKVIERIRGQWGSQR